MPYIKEDRREMLARRELVPANPGELNYVITDVIRSYWDFGKTYTAANDILGALDAASKEFYRRVVVPYEDAKIKENGDVY